MSILIDSSIFCAYSNTMDVHHQKSKKIIEEVILGKYGKPIITDYIFDEVVSVVLRKKDKVLAIEVGKYLLNSEFLLVRINEAVFDNAWNNFQEKNSFSFTDCTSIGFMKFFEIYKIATFDKEFKNLKNILVID